MGLQVRQRATARAKQSIQGRVERSHPWLWYYVAPVVGLVLLGYVAWSKLRSAAHAHDPVLAEAKVATVVVSLVLVALAGWRLIAHYQDRRTKAESKNAAVQLRSHRGASTLLLLAGIGLGALPSGLARSVTWQVVLTLAVVAVAGTWAWGVSGSQPHGEPIWRVAFRLGAPRPTHGTFGDYAELRRKARQRATKAHLGNETLVGVSWLWWPAWLNLGKLAFSAVVVLGSVLAAGRLGWWGGDAGLVAVALYFGVPKLRRAWRASGVGEDWLDVAHRVADAAKVAVTIDEWQPLDEEWGCKMEFERGASVSTIEGAADRLRGSLDDEQWLVTEGLSSISVIPRDALPRLAPMPAEVTTDQWKLPIGVARLGAGEGIHSPDTVVVVDGTTGMERVVRQVVLDVGADPHALIAGKTGSGKSVTIVDLAVQALLRGWDLVVAETTKRGVDFSPLRPWCRGFATSLPQVVEVLEATYAEVQRRADVLVEHGYSKCADLPSDVRADQHCQPMLVVLDEFFSMTAKARAKTEAAKEINDLRSEIEDYVSRLMREARFVDVHLTLGMQRPDATVFSGETKANTGARVLAGTSDDVTRPMVLRDANAAPLVKKGALGRGIVETEVEDADLVQLYYVDPREVPAILDEAGPVVVPRPSKLVFNLWERLHGSERSASPVLLVPEHKVNEETPPADAAGTDAPKPKPRPKVRRIRTVVDNGPPSTPPPLPE